MILSKLDVALRRAADYEQRARMTSNPDLRDFYNRLRNSWLAAANKLEGVESRAGEHAA